MIDGMVAGALVDVCMGRVPQLPRDAAVNDRFVTAVRLHRIAPLAHVVLRGDRPDIADRLAVDRAAALAKHMRSMVVLDELDDAIGDIPWAAFKGPILSEYFHPVPGLRSYGDLDVLVAPEDLREVAALVETVGWSAGDHEGHQRNPETPGEMHWRTPSGLTVDMHWSMINNAHVRHRHMVPTGQLLARARRARVGLAEVPILDPVDGFAHLCMHAGLSGAHRMLWLLDVEQMARHLPAWEPVFERAKQWHIEAHMALVLRRVSAFLGLSIPGDASERLGVSTLSCAIMEATDRWSPVPGLRRDASLAKAVSRGIRSSGLDTLAAMGRKAMLGTWHRRPVLAREPEPAPLELADRAARNAYLGAVEAEAEQPLP